MLSMSLSLKTKDCLWLMMPCRMCFHCLCEFISFLFLHSLHFCHTSIAFWGSWTLPEMFLPQALCICFSCSLSSVLKHLMIPYHQTGWLNSHLYSEVFPDHSVKNCNVSHCLFIPSLLNVSYRSSSPSDRTYSQLFNHFLREEILIYFVQ